MKGEKKDDYLFKNALLKDRYDFKKSTACEVIKTNHAYLFRFLKTFE